MVILLLLVLTAECPAQEQGCTDPPGIHGGIRVIGVTCIGGAAGRIEICVSGEWRAVCDDQWWGPADARIVCHQLGFDTQGMS